MKKSKLLLPLLVMSMALTFVGCGNKSNDTTSTTNGDYNSQSSVEDNTVEPEPKVTQEKSGKIGDLTVSIDSAETVKSRDGKKSLLVTYSVKNGSDVGVVVDKALSAEAYQHDTACPQASLADDRQDIENLLTMIPAGATKKVYEAYVLQDDSDVTIRVCREGLTADQEQNDTTMITRTFKVPAEEK